MDTAGRKYAVYAVCVYLLHTGFKWLVAQAVMVCVTHGDKYILQEWQLLILCKAWLHVYLLLLLRCMVCSVIALCAASLVCAFAHLLCHTMVLC